MYSEGPWQLCYEADDSLEIRTSDGTKVICTIDSDSRSKPGPKTCLANAKLIAASPELFEAADEVLCNLVDSGLYGPGACDVDPDGDLPQDEDGDYWWHDTWNLREALNKASGEVSDFSEREQLLSRFRTCVGSSLDKRSDMLFHAVELMTDEQLSQLLFSCEAAECPRAHKC